MALIPLPMAAYVFIHTITGVRLAGYRLGDADPSEITGANARLAACCSPYRLAPDGPEPPSPHTQQPDGTSPAA